MSDQVPTLEIMSEHFVKKVGIVTIGTLQAYLRCGYVRAAKLINAMESAGIIERTNDYQWKLKNGEAANDETC